MTTLRKVLPLLLLPLMCFSQGNQNNIQLGLVDASASAWKFPARTFTNLPAAASSTGQRFTVTDCLTSACTAGSGTLRQDMVSTGSAWVPAVTLIGATAGILYAAADSTTTHALFATAGGPAFRAIASTDIPALAYVTSVGWTGGLVTVATGTTTPAFTVAGTSGGIPYFSSASTWASSGALTQYFAILGGGAGNPPTVSTIKDDGTAVTITQNSVVPFTSVASGALANTLYLNAGKVGINTGSATSYLHLLAGSSTIAPSLTYNSAAAVTFNQSSVELAMGVQTGGQFWMQNRLFNNTFAALLLNPLGGNVGIGWAPTSVPYSLDVSRGYGISGTARFFDQTATNGATLVTITPGAAQSTSSLVLDIQASARFGGSNSTAAVAGLIGTTCPALTCTAAYTWVKAIAADNSVVYFPVWK